MNTSDNQNVPHAVIDIGELTITGMKDANGNAMGSVRVMATLSFTGREAAGAFAILSGQQKMLKVGLSGHD